MKQRDTIKIVPSILSADLSILKEQVKAVERAGADWIHLDIMDGHFVPNITFGPLVVEAVNRSTDLPLDVHLMIVNPDEYIPQFRQAGADLITVHVEVSRHLHRTIQLIKSTGALAGVTLNPATPATMIEAILPEVDLVLAMTVNPGFGGQQFIPSVLTKIKTIASLIKEIDKKIYLEVDGGIDTETAPQVVRAGADVLVAGSAIYNASDIGLAVRALREAAEKGLD
ncbi:MAG: ribulose-phosphate 3-epimerase [candidate division KSB1 bacterium]|nr:ribulose-phosphate 3-epimerase [candidate division KSB1 bacterium]